ncbi:NHR-62 protein, partial [Aphelenchoides avenae]
IVLAKHRFAAFHWWICGLWTLEAGCDGICYGNGAYFPRGSSVQCVADASDNFLSKVTELTAHSLVEPLKKLKLSDVEKCCLYAITLFANDDIPLSEEGRKATTEARETYVRVLHNQILYQRTSGGKVLFDNASVQLTQQSDAAVRLSSIVGLIPALSALSSLSGNQGKLGDVLHLGYLTQAEEMPSSSTSYAQDSQQSNDLITVD